MFKKPNLAEKRTNLAEIPVKNLNSTEFMEFVFSKSVVAVLENYSWHIELTPFVSNCQHLPDHSPSPPPLSALSVFAWPPSPMSVIVSNFHAPFSCWHKLWTVPRRQLNIEKNLIKILSNTINKFGKSTVYQIGELLVSKIINLW